MSRAEEPLAFRASLPAWAQPLCWVPVQTVTLCLDLPSGFGTFFHVWHCRQTRQFAHNVGQVAGPKEMA